jgi:hypothetical protein
MPSALTAFLGGAAAQATTMIEAEKKNAKELAAAQASALLKNYMEVDKQAKELSNKMASDVEFLKGYYPDVSDDDLVEAAKNPEAMSVFKKKASEADFDSRLIKFSDFVTVASKNSGKDFRTQINELYDIKKLQAAPPPVEANVGFFKQLVAGTGEAELKRIVEPFGVSPDQLRAAMTYKPSVTSEAKFNLSALSTKTFEAEMDKAKLAVVRAQELPKDDPKRDPALQEATTTLARFVMTKSLTSTEGLTNEKILSNMVTEIQGLPKDSTERKALEEKLKERKALMSNDKDFKKTEADYQTDLINRILEAKKANKTQEARELEAELAQRKALSKDDTKGDKDPTPTNYIVAASRAMATAISEFVPKGSFSITTNPDGSQSFTPTSMTKTEDWQKAIKMGKQSIISSGIYTNANGVPKSEAHKLALSAVGINFDRNGVVVVDSVAPPPPAPAPAAPAPAAAPAPKPLPSRTKTATMADVNAFAAQKKLSPAQVKADLEKNGYKIVD